MTFSFDLGYHAGARALRSSLDTSASRVAIVGPSGIGKTSLLRAILGVAPSSGPIALKGARLETLAVEVRGCGWVPQDGALFSHLSVDGNIAFGSVEPSVDRAVELVGVAALRMRMPAALSGGERQRVAIGRAIARRPRLYVLDEPLSALDRSARRAMAEAIEHERREHDATILLASHDESDVAALADEVYEMAQDGALTRRSSAG